MKENRKALGKAGEDDAALYLAGNGYQIVARNVRPIPGMSRGEIDIVAWDRNILVFVEVKTRRRTLSNQGYPSESINYTKRRQLVKLANAYIGINRINNVACRFDVVFVIMQPDIPVQVHHIHNAFDATDW